jgi:hypothetical protein
MKAALQILLFLFFLLFTGCVTLYKPNTINSPLIKEKGDLTTSASIGLSGSGLFNSQSAFAISNHTGLMLNGMYHSRRFSGDDSSVEKLKMFFCETGAGYFTSEGKDNNWLFQCYSGFGYGSTSDKISNNTSSNPEVSAKYFNIFIQPGFAYIGKNIQVSFDMRANYVHLFDIHAYLYDQFEWWNTDSKFYSDTTLNFVNLEPAITIQAGSGKLKGVFQLGLILPTINPETYFDISTESMLIAPLIKFSAGIKYTFGKKKRADLLLSD